MNKKLVNVNNIDALAHYNITKIVVAIGVFDGVHRGHQALLKKLQKMAKDHDATAVVMTFYPHPRAVLNSKTTPKLIIDNEERKLELLSSYGINTVITIPFNNNFAKLSAEEFIQNCLLSHDVQICGLCVGSKWRFGAKGKGTITDLHEFADAGHFEFEAQDEIFYGEIEISSSEIRRLIPNGEFHVVEELLGRPYELSGEVVKGFQIASSQLGFATANIDAKNSIIPPNGVYAARAIITTESGKSKAYPAAVNIGLAPTFNLLDGDTARVEAHLLDFVEQDLYGDDIRLEFLAYLREERTFADVQQLKEQISLDVNQVKNIYQKKFK
ncbi:bifunctional riboflavin kinase/FAD synthetase [Lentisphaerota bacterium WC36G]|nr:bifunctional riboflavin kinase/FAD synthetase [Lentisphaerae bacterium WC36]